MQILIAPDKFRGSLDALQVCEAVEKGILMAIPSARVIKTPLADGGEGTAEILTLSQGGRFANVRVQDPLGRETEASYGVSGDGSTAYIELASASGLRLLATDERNPLLTTTFGTGQLIAHALDQGIENLILGIGGSATTDAGIGLAAALGYRFLDQDENELPPIGENLIRIAKIDDRFVHPCLANCRITVACDVTNPLYGPTGAACVYAPQKGADPQMVELLDQGLKSFAQIANLHFGKNVDLMPGAGAAGGVGAGAVWFLNARLQEGVKIVMDQLRLPEIVKNVDLVITGEGKADEQTLSGKVVQGLASLCREADVPLALLCGTLEITPQQAKDAGIIYATSVLNRPMDLATAQQEAYERVVETAYYLANLLRNFRS